MFSPTFEANIVESAVTALPQPVYTRALTVFLIYLVPYSAYFNVVFSLVELGAGILLISGKKQLWFAGNALGAVFGFVVWFFGEGLGGLTTLTVVHLSLRYPESLVTGFPGAGLLYSIISLLLLGFAKGDRLSEASRYVATMLLGAGELIQLLPQYWMPDTQYSMFTSSVLMGETPKPLVAPTIRLALTAAANPLLSNTLEILFGLTLVACLALRVRLRWILPLACAYLGFIWVFGMGLMGLLGGQATDPGTPPLLLLLILATYAQRSKESGQAGQDPTLSFTED